jgi:hypothetical protein
MDMLASAGYAVGRGSTNTGRIEGYSFNKSQWLTDDAIRADLQWLVSNHYLPANDPNRLYVIFVEPGLAVWAGNHTLGYHSAVNGMAYAVIPFPGGINATPSAGLSTFGNLTAVTSHELAEAVTDPLTYYNPYYRTSYSWFDDTYGYYYHGEGEIGDIINLTQRYPFVLLNNYAVEKMAGQYDQPLSPAGSFQLYVTVGAGSSGGGFSFPATDGPAKDRAGLLVMAPAKADLLLEAPTPKAGHTGLHAKDIRHARDGVFAQWTLDEGTEVWDPQGSIRHSPTG